MASKVSASCGLFLALNLLLFAVTSACPSCGDTGNSGGPGGGIIGGGPGGGIIGGGSGGGGSGGGGGGGYGGGGGGGTSGWYGKCPTDALKLHVCANVLDLIKAKVGVPPLNDRCCPLLNGLVDLDAAICLCTAIKADVLGIHINLPIHLSLILNFCGKGVPTGFMCPT
uniref:Bifunctional inhibitor/plant lipid transfer protein/seed storage helical domain-containing protein n=1 Tax=Aegilops tauschii subsp. strangulata TaxID=200361 RepID=A0A452YUB6_AEGTS